MKKFLRGSCVYQTNIQHEASERDIHK
jgi:hypothetical protein